MLLFVIGPPGRLADWCGAVTARLAEGMLGRCEVMAANTLDEIARSLLRSGSSHAVIAGHQAGGRLRRALIEAGRPFVVALDDPRAALHALVTERGSGFVAATRVIASSCVSARCFCESAGALVLHADRVADDPVALAAAIAHHFAIDLDEAQMAQAAQGAGGGSRLPQRAEIMAWWDALRAPERVLAEGALGPFLGAAADSGPPIRWGAELFAIGEAADGHDSAGSIDITGRARCLMRGPRILLPPGAWSLSMAFDVSPEAAEHRFMLEVAGGAQPSHTIFAPSAGGIVTAGLGLAIEELADQPFELALSNERPAFSGQLRLLEVTVMRQPPAPRDLVAATGTSAPDAIAPATVTSETGTR